MIGQPVEQGAQTAVLIVTLRRAAPLAQQHQQLHKVHLLLRLACQRIVGGALLQLADKLPSLRQHFITNAPVRRIVAILLLR